MRTKEELPACPVATTVSLIGSKWKLLILRNLRIRSWRFNELKQDLDGISQKVLTDSLRSLEKDGIITRTVYPEIPPRVEYALSPIGKSMEPIILAMETWGKKYQALHLSTKIGHKTKKIRHKKRIDVQDSSTFLTSFKLVRQTMPSIMQTRSADGRVTFPILLRRQVA